MKIELSKAGKRFNREWIFREVSLTFTSGAAYAITGNNGSGKSTLLQSIGGMLQLSEGSIGYSKGQALIDPTQAFKQISFSAPYLSVIEEMTLREFLSFHSKFKDLLPGLDASYIASRIGLNASIDKQIRLYSSGMKQRVRLAQAIFSNTEILLLDEPCSNLDAAGIGLYHELIAEFCRSKIIIVSSNDESEYNFCESILSMSDLRAH